MVDEKEYLEYINPGPVAGVTGTNGGPPDLMRIGELSARGIDKISIETADQIREIGKAAVTHAETIRAEADALADSIIEQGRKFSDRVAAFTTTAEGMLQSMNEQRARLHKSNFGGQ